MSSGTTDETIHIRPARSNELAWLRAWLVSGQTWNPAWEQPGPARDGNAHPAPGWWIAEVHHEHELGQRIVGAVRLEMLPGSYAALYGPRCLPNAPRQTFRQLLSHTLQTARNENKLRFIQTLRPKEKDPAETDLADCGFQRVTTVAFLVWPVALGVPQRAIASDITFEPVQFGKETSEAARHAAEPSAQAKRWEAAVQATYADSLDFPELDTPGWEHLLAGSGHTGFVTEGSAVGTGGALQAWIVQWAGHDAGCVVYQAGSDTENAQCVYLGLAPVFRGQGRGRLLMQFLQQLAVEQGAKRLLAECDIRNNVAIRVYDDAGFYVYDERALWVCWL